MKDKIFLDTNILLYQFGKDLVKKKKAIDIVTEAVETDRYAISYQVIQEFSNIALKDKQGYFTFSELKQYTQDILFPLCKFYPYPDFYIESLRIKTKYKYSYYDRLILTSAILLGCSKIYTEDLNTGQKLEGLKIVNPFID
jgi:predicted nucleic acid-binding protein